MKREIEYGRMGTMKKKNFLSMLTMGIILFIINAFWLCVEVIPADAALNSAAPTVPVKLVFLHHSTGENWLADDNGKLGIALNNNNYFVSDTYYGWGPDSIGDNTDIGHWYNWFLGTNRDTYMAAVYANNVRTHEFTRMSDPGGENEIIMFKSCFPNSQISGNPEDQPTSGENSLRGEDASSGHMTVSNIKGIYNDLLTYFEARQDKLFVVITAPPLQADETNPTHAANARAINNWLVNDWLSTYPYRNVIVFDFYNVLTSNGGSSSVSDAGSSAGNHHRYRNGVVEHIQTVLSNTSAYPTSSGDSHPSVAGNEKATAEYVPLLNVFYHCWKGTGSCPEKFLIDITANNSHGPVTVSLSSPVSIALSLSGGPYAGKNADWWVAELTVSDWRTYVHPAGWSQGLNMAYQGGIFNLGSTQLLNSTLSPGTHTFFFGVDFTPDGAVSFNTLRYKPVVVNVQ